MGNKQSKSPKDLYHSPNSITKKALPTAKDTILVSGYVRRIEKLLDSYLFPTSITDCIYRYFRSKNILFWLSPQHIYSVCIEKDDTKERVNPLLKMDQCYCPAVCYKSNIMIPTFMNDDEKYNAIFKCGGIANDRSLLQECMATVMKPPTINKPNENQFLCNINLPLLPQQIASNCVLFHDTYGLLSIGGFVGTYNNWNSLPRRYISNVYNLPFNEKHKQTITTNDDDDNETDINGADDEDEYKFEPEWEWNNLTSMNECRGYSSCSIINNKQLIVIGGDLEIGNTYSNTAEIYNFETDEWRYLANMKHGRICSGMHFDKDINTIYVGGGYCDSRIEMYSNFKKVEIYNTVKNKWYPFPDTNLKHAFYPYLWKHHNILFIASAYSTGLEYIDLRCGMSWQAIYGDKIKKKKKFWKLFNKNNINTNTGAICSGRLVG